MQDNFRQFPAGHGEMARQDKYKVGNSNLFGSEVIPVRISFELQPKEALRSLAAGFYHSLALTDTGTVFQWGWATFVGPESTQTRGVPRRIPTAHPIRALAAGRRHSCLVDTLGQVWTVGVGENFQLGHGTDSDVDEPKRVDALHTHRVKKVSAGWGHSVALAETGQVFTWGWNEEGQCGQSAAQRVVELPTPLVSLQGVKVVDIASGTDHTLFVDTEGNLFGCGRNDTYQLGFDSKHQNVNEARQIQLPNGAKAKLIAGAHSLVVDQDGNLYSFGRNSLGECGVNRLAHPLVVREPTPIEGLKAHTVSAGRIHSMVVTKEGELVAFGGGANGRLGILDRVSFHDSPQPVVFEEENGSPLKPGSAVVGVACGMDHNLALLSEP